MRAWEAVAARSQPSREAALGALQAPMLGRDAELARLAALTRRPMPDRRAARRREEPPPRRAGRAAAGDGAARARPPAGHGAVRDGGAAGDRGGWARAAAGAPRGGGRGRATGVGGGRRGRRGCWIPPARPPARAATWRPSAKCASTRGSPRSTRWSPDRATWLVEDVHWAGGDLLAFLDHAGRARGAAHRGHRAAEPARIGARSGATARSGSTSRRCPRAHAADLVTRPRRRRPPAGARRCDRGTRRRDATLHRGAAAYLGERRHAGPRRTRRGASRCSPNRSSCRRRCRPSTPPSSTTCRPTRAPWLVAARSRAAGCRSTRSPRSTCLTVRRASPPSTAARSSMGRSTTRSPALRTPTAMPCCATRATRPSPAPSGRASTSPWPAGWQETAGPRADLVAEGIGEHLASALDSLLRVRGPGPPGPRRRWPAKPQRGTTVPPRPPSAWRRWTPRDGCLRRADRSHPCRGCRCDGARRRLRLGEVLAQSAELDLGIAEIEAARDDVRHRPVAAGACSSARPTRLGVAYMQQIRFPEAERLTQEAITSMGGGTSDPLPPASTRCTPGHAPPTA